MFRQDWLQRQMKALTELVARVATLLRNGQPEEVMAIVRDESTRILGADPSVLEVVDERTVFVLLGDEPARVVRYAALLGLEADAREATGDAEHAARLRPRAESLRAAALERVDASRHQ